MNWSTTWMLHPGEGGEPIHSNAQSGLSYVLGGYGRRRGGGERPGGWWILTEVLVDLGPGQVFRPDLAGDNAEHEARLP